MSNQPFEVRLQKMFAFLGSLAPPILCWLIFMSVFRFITWFAEPSIFQLVAREDLLMAFFVGFRFDLLVVGFLLIPVVVVAEALAILGFWNLNLEKSIKVALSVLWSIVVLFSYLDFLFYFQFHRRWTWFDAQLSGLQFIFDGWKAMEMRVSVMTGLLVLGLWIVGGRQVERTHSLFIEDRHPQNWQKAFMLLLPILVVGLMARGTVTPHHLERRHSQISGFAPLNELAINVLWAFDKQP